MGQKDLVRNIYFEKIFNDLRLNYDDSVGQVEIMEDGSWKAVIETKKDQKQQKMAQDIVDTVIDQIIVLSSDDENDESLTNQTHTHVVDLLESSDDEITTNDTI